jgi:hypothetical protein
MFAKKHTHYKQFICEFLRVKGITGPGQRQIIQK